MKQGSRGGSRGTPVLLSKKETGKVGEYRKLSKNHIQTNTSAEKIRLRSQGGSWVAGEYFNKELGSEQKDLNNDISQIV